MRQLNKEGSTIVMVTHSSTTHYLPATSIRMLERAVCQRLRWKNYSVIAVRADARCAYVRPHREYVFWSPCAWHA